MKKVNEHRIVFNIDEEVTINLILHTSNDATAYIGCDVQEMIVDMIDKVNDMNTFCIADFVDTIKFYMKHKKVLNILSQIQYVYIDTSLAQSVIYDKYEFLIRTLHELNIYKPFKSFRHMIFPIVEFLYIILIYRDKLQSNPLYTIIVLDKLLSSDTNIVSNCTSSLSAGGSHISAHVRFNVNINFEFRWVGPFKRKSADKAIFPIYYHVFEFYSDNPESDILNIREIINHYFSGWMFLYTLRELKLNSKLYYVYYDNTLLQYLANILTAVLVDSGYLGHLYKDEYAFNNAYLRSVLEIIPLIQSFKCKHPIVSCTADVQSASFNSNISTPTIEL